MEKKGKILYILFRVRVRVKGMGDVSTVNTCSCEHSVNVKPLGMSAPPRDGVIDYAMCKWGVYTLRQKGGRTFRFSICYCRSCFFTMESTNHKSRFMAGINNSFGSGGMSLAFPDVQFASFIQFLKAESKERLVIQKAVSVIGKQPCKQPVWVLGDDMQINSDGCKILTEEQTHVWLSCMIAEQLGNISPKEVLPEICVPLDTAILGTVLEKIRRVMQHNFFPSVLVIAGAVMSMHYTTLLECGGCPTVVATGQSETGKSTSIRVGMSLMGMLFSWHL